jgi:hypothetical protein
VKPFKILADLDIFFSKFPRGDQRKNAEKPVYSFGNFSAFFLGNYNKKLSK